jgi:hypothetical protein
VAQFAQQFSSVQLFFLHSAMHSSPQPALAQQAGVTEVFCKAPVSCDDLLQADPLQPSVAQFAQQFSSVQLFFLHSAMHASPQPAFAQQVGISDFFAQDNNINAPASMVINVFIFFLIFWLIIDF